MRRWSEEATVKFVKLYCELDCLWDTTRPEYKNQLMRSDALQQLVVAMDMEDFDIGEARVKVKSLRNTYSQELKKIERAKEQNENYIPAMRWFEIMDTTLRKLKTIGPRTNAFNNLGAFTNFTEQEIFAYDAEEEIYDEVGVIEENPLELPSTTTATMSIPELGEAWNGAPSRKRSRQDFGRLPEQYRSRPPTLAEEDEFDAFGKYMAQGLKNMPIHMALQCQSELQATLTRFRFMSLGAPPLTLECAHSSLVDQQGTSTQGPSIKAENFEEVCIVNLGCN